MTNKDTIWAMILAGGKGTRMKSKDKNKVTLSVGGKPMIARTVDNLKNAGISQILVVVGFARSSVETILDSTVQFAEQKKRLGTGHALKVGFAKLPYVKDVMVLYGDDSFIYTPEIFEELYKQHTHSRASLSFLTIMVDDPKGLGRILRNGEGKVVGIVEEKDANDTQRLIKEINPALYIFSYDFLKKNLSRIQKSPITGEYYLTSLIEMAVEQKVTIETLTVEGLQWRGVNTPTELEEAQKIFT